MKYIVGAYATAASLGNNDKSIEHKFYEKLIESMDILDSISDMYLKTFIKNSNSL